MRKSILAAVSGLALVSALTSPCLAVVSETGEHTATVPVTLTVVHTTKYIDVTVPLSMPISLVDGKVLTAENVFIQNNSDTFGVEVESIEVESGLYDIIGFDETPDGQKQLALQMNGIKTTGSGQMPITKEAFPDLLPEETLEISYDAKVSDTADVSGLEIAHVVFTLKSFIPTTG